ncbi:putative nuclease HARBI1 [Lucilia cuprina]|nr:putative nuclease HARBI1 [Lucilia cuprina]
MLRIYRQKLRDTTDPFTIPEQRFKDLYRDIGQDFTASVSKTVVCRSIHEVAGILEQKLMPKWITFPTPSQYESIKQKNFKQVYPQLYRFYEQTEFPGVIGAIDCTHVRIKKPKPEVESCYLNRKGYHSKNVQLICDYDLKILGGFARFGGVAHDSNIWEASRINVCTNSCQFVFYSKTRYSVDSGYPLRPWLLTPYRSATENERRYNTVHAQARNCVERLNGVLKSVFRCLQGGLNTSPQNAGKIINACAVLHNFRLAHGLLSEDYLVNLEEHSDTSNEEEYEEPLRAASRIRDRLKSRFSNLN